MTTKAINGTEVAFVENDKGQCLYFPNPANEETKMGLWNDLFGESAAKIMRNNYNSHTKNGYKDANGNKVRNIRDLDGNILFELELKTETNTANKTVVPPVSLSDAIGVYKEIAKMNNPALKKALELQMNIIKTLISPALLATDIDTLKFIIELKKSE
jgi:hypothetical protein